MYLSPEILAAAGGAVLLVSVAIWRLTARRQPVKLLRRALVDADVATRRAAVTIAAERGLRPWVDLLIERTRIETDPTVRRELAAAVARNQWEPTDKRGLLELRLWAQTQLSTNGDVAGSHRADWPTTDSNGAGLTAAAGPAMANGVSPSHQNHAPPGAAPPALVEGSRQQAAGAVSWNPTEGATAPKAPSTAMTSKATRRTRTVTTVKAIVTGAGGPAGIAVIRALQRAGHDVVAVDADSLAAGLRLAPQAGIVPRSDDPTLVRVLVQIATATEANMLIPTVAEELPALAEFSQALKAAGLRIWLPDPRAVHTCLDKWAFANFASERGIPVPPTALGSSDGVPGAWVVKPRFGRGSRDVHFVDRQSDLPWYLQQVPEPIVQTRLEGREFTVDALVDRKGRLAGAVPRWRLAVRGGISVKGRTFEDAALVEAVANLLTRLRLCGPSNVQGVMSVDGSVTFIEVNPRFSGGLPLSLAAGADLVGEYVRAISNQPIRPERLRARPGVTMIRHFEELFE